VARSLEGLQPILKDLITGSGGEQRLNVRMGARECCATARRLKQRWCPTSSSCSPREIRVALWPPTLLYGRSAMGLERRNVVCDQCHFALSEARLALAASFSCASQGGLCQMLLLWLSEMAYWKRRTGCTSSQIEKVKIVTVSGPARRDHCGTSCRYSLTLFVRRSRNVSKVSTVTCKGASYT
jgi:hypothetical protein